MIQRIQSLLLLLVILISMPFSFFNLFEFSSEGVVYLMSAYKTYAVENISEVVSKNMGVGVLQGLVMLTSLFVIFQFKKRQLQMKLLKLNLLLITLQIVAIVLYADVAKSTISSMPEQVETTIGIGAIVPILCMILVYLSIRFIKKDDDMVRAADRLR